MQLYCMRREQSKMDQKLYDHADMIFSVESMHNYGSYVQACMQLRGLTVNYMHIAGGMRQFNPRQQDA
jgi:cAMP phosphodiesterase